MTIIAPNIYLTIDDTRWSSKRLGLETLCAEVIGLTWKTIRKKNSPPIFVSISFSNDKTIKSINSKTRGKNKPTNILSFQNFDSVETLPVSNIPLPIGDLILSIETIEREALSEGKRLKHHVAHLLIHGFLHLFGYDHMDEDEAKVMETLEIKLLKRLGISNPYD
jgi:probable rRNA maturation factor